MQMLLAINLEMSSTYQLQNMILEEFKKATQVHENELVWGLFTRSLMCEKFGLDDILTAAIIQQIAQEKDISIPFKVIHHFVYLNDEIILDELVSKMPLFEAMENAFAENEGLFEDVLDYLIELNNQRIQFYQEEGLIELTEIDN